MCTCKKQRNSYRHDKLNVCFRCFTKQANPQFIQCNTATTINVQFFKFLAIYFYQIFISDIIKLLTEKSHNYGI